MAQGVMQKIGELSEERERLIAREGSHHAAPPITCASGR
jgi:hypothetical protein